MGAQALDVVDTEIETSSDSADSGKKNNSSSMKLERRRRIEELNEERFRREEWGEF